MNKQDAVKGKSSVSRLGRQAIVSVSAFLIAMLLSMVIIAIMDIDPIKAVSAMITGSLGGIRPLGDTVVKMIPLIFTGLSYAIACRCGLTNLGMEGQLYIGALCSTLVGVYCTGLPAFLHVPLAVIAGFLGGAVWGGIAGILKVKCGASEIITTVMLNSVAISFVAYMVNGPIMAPPYLDAYSSNVADTAKLNRLAEGTRVHWGFVLGLVMVLCFWLFLWKSKKGFEIRLSGHNMNAARYSGINTEGNVMLVMFLAGGLGGLAGASEILGVQFRLMSSISPGYGFDGMAVSLIGLNTPVGIVIGAFLFGVLRNGGNSMQMMAKVPVSIISVIQAFVIIFIAASALILEKWNERELTRARAYTEDAAGAEPVGGQTAPPGADPQEEVKVV